MLFAFVWSSYWYNICSQSSILLTQQWRSSYNICNEITGPHTVVSLCWCPLLPPRLADAFPVTWAGTLLSRDTPYIIIILPVHTAGRCWWPYLWIMYQHQPKCAPATMNVLLWRVAALTCPRRDSKLCCVLPVDAVNSFHHLASPVPSSDSGPRRFFMFFSLLHLKRFLPAGLRVALPCRYCFYSLAQNGFFAPQGRHVAPINVYRGKMWEYCPQNCQNFEFWPEICTSGATRLQYFYEILSICTRL